MYCLGCDYSLEGILAGKCPECGRAFDPADASTSRPTRSKRLRLPIWFAVTAAAWPCFVHCWVLLMLCIGRLALGQWPVRGGLHDPKSLACVQAMYPIAIIMLMLTPVSVPALLTFPWLQRRGTRWVTFSTGIGVWLFGAAMIWIDPARVFYWLMD
jgi:hypothetical protein